MRRLLTLVGSLAWAAPAAAQTIRVRTIEIETQRVIAGAIVVLLDSTGRRLVQGLTDDLGRITLQAPAPGTYRLKADRIGHVGIIGPPFHATDGSSITLEMPAERFLLPEIAVAGSSACGRRAEGEQTARLWEEVQKALAASEITANTERVELAVRRFRRYRSLNGTLRSDSTVRSYTTRESPFVSVDPGSLRTAGYIQSSGGSYRFLGPDAALLLSDQFLEDHCFRVAPAASGMPNSVGLGFEPVPGTDVPEIKGTLWVDRATGELRVLDFEYVNVPSALRVRGLGGRFEFERLPQGTWIIRDWYIRTPDRVAFQRRPGARRPVTQADTIVGLVDEGGTARPLGDASVHLAEAALRTSDASITLYDVRGRVVSSAGGPLEGALIAVAGLDTVLATGPNGAFRLRGLPTGTLRLRLRAIGHAPLGVDIVLAGDRRLLDTTVTLSAVAQQLDSIIVTERETPFRAGKMAGFDRRRKEGFGRFLTMGELHDPLRATLDLQLRRFGRIHLAWVSCISGYAAAALGQQAPPGSRASCKAYPEVLDACFMTVYMDGALYYTNSMPGPPLDISKFNLLTLQGVEVYRSAAEMPVEYNATGSACGVILLWTR